MRIQALLIAALFAASPLQGQSLGEAAAKEKERRAKKAGSGKTFGDSDLQEAAAKRQREGSFPSTEGASPSPSPSPSPSSSPAPSPSPPAAGTPSPKPDGAGEGSARAKTEGPQEGGEVGPVAGGEPPEDTAAIEKAKRARGLEYKNRLETANAQLKAAEERLKAAEEQWNKVYLHSVGFPIQEAAKALDAARKEYARWKKERDDIEDAARREGIPPGYMR